MQNVYKEIIDNKLFSYDQPLIMLKQKKNKIQNIEWKIMT